MNQLDKELTHFVKENNVVQATQILQQGGHIDHLNDYPLIKLATKHDNLEMIQLLAQYGARLKMIKKYGSQKIRQWVDNQENSAISL